MWGLRLTRLASLLAIFLLAGAWIGAQDAAKAQVLVVNCHQDDIDLQVGDDPVFSLSHVPPATPTSFLTVPGDTAFPLYFKSSSSETWRYFRSEDTQESGVSFPAGRLTVIRIDRSGGVELIDLADLGDDSLASARGDPDLPAQVFFLNAGGAPLPGMQLVDQSLTVVAEVAAIPGQAFTGLVSVAAGELAGLVPVNGQPPSASGAAADGAVLQLIAIQAGQRYVVVASGEVLPVLNIWHIGARL